MNAFPIIADFGLEQQLRRAAALVAIGIATVLTAQTIVTTATQNQANNIVHVSVTWTWSNGTKVTQGFYPNGVQDDSWRVNGYMPGATLVTVGTNDSTVSQSYQNFIGYTGSHSWQATSSNCGSAADAALANTSASWMSDMNAHASVAVAASTYSVISNSVSSFFGAVVDVVRGWFGGE